MTNIDEGYLTLMDDNGAEREDIKIPAGDIGEEIQAKFKNEDQFTVTVLKAMDEEHVIAIKALTT